MAWLPLTLLACTLGIQLVLSARVGGILGMILGAQALYWGLSYLARPFYLLQAEPVSPLLLGDQRMVSGGYEDTLTPTLWIALVGELTFLAVALLSFRAWLHLSGSNRGFTFSVQANSLRTPEHILPVGVFFWCLGWLGRFVGQAGQGGNALGQFGVVGSSILIVFLSQRKGRWLAAAPILIFALEIVWSFQFGSKAAFIVPLLAFCVRWRVLHPDRSVLVPAIVLGVVATSGFLILQPLRGIDTAQEVTAQSGGSGAGLEGATVSLLERFDGISSVADAYFLGPGNWKPAGDFASEALLAVLPKGPWGQSDETMGQEWTREVKAPTFENQYLDVSLAYGPTAEGYALAGYLGVLVSNCFFAVATVGASLLLESRKSTAAYIFGANIVFGATLFEQASLGVLGAVNKSIQLCLVAVIVLMLLRNPSRSGAVGSYANEVAR